MLIPCHTTFVDIVGFVNDVFAETQRESCHDVNFSSMVAPKLVMTTCGATSDEKVNFGFVFGIHIRCIISCFHFHMVLPW